MYKYMHTDGRRIFKKRPAFRSHQRHKKGSDDDLNSELEVKAAHDFFFYLIIVIMVLEALLSLSLSLYIHYTCGCCVYALQRKVFFGAFSLSLSLSLPVSLTLILSQSHFSSEKSLRGERLRFYINRATL